MSACLSNLSITAWIGPITSVVTWYLHQSIGEDWVWAGRAAWWCTGDQTPPGNMAVLLNRSGWSKDSPRSSQNLLSLLLLLLSSIPSIVVIYYLACLIKPNFLAFMSQLEVKTEEVTGWYEFQRSLLRPKQGEHHVTELYLVSSGPGCSFYLLENVSIIQGVTLGHLGPDIFCTARDSTPTRYIGSVTG